MIDPKVRAAYREFATTPQGEIILRDLYDFCGIGKSARLTTEEMHFNEGLRRVWLHFFSLCFRQPPDEEEGEQLQQDPYSLYRDMEKRA